MGFSLIHHRHTDLYHTIHVRPAYCLDRMQKLSLYYPISLYLLWSGIVLPKLDPTSLPFPWNKLWSFSNHFLSYVLNPSMATLRNTDIQGLSSYLSCMKEEAVHPCNHTFYSMATAPCMADVDNGNLQ